MYNQMADATSVTDIEIDNHVHTRHQEIKNLVNDMSHVSINSSSNQLEEIKNSLKELSEINEARVLYFKSEIAIGNYQINYDAIAKRMLDVAPA